jgi:hypothetical protein
MKRKTILLLPSLTLAIAVIFSIVDGGQDRPADALPKYAREYNQPCSACHTVAPALNSFGMAFYANHFNWPTQHPPVRRTGLDAFPISGLTTNVSDTPQGGPNATDFLTQELFASDGFAVTRQSRGGYFVDEFAFVRNGQGEPGDFGDAFISMPVAGNRGQYALTLGQFTPMMYQYEANNSLPANLPLGFGTEDNFNFLNSVPSIRLDYFDNEDRGSANGMYYSVGVPFNGQLALNKDSDMDGPAGVYANAFRRKGYDSIGMFGYGNGGSGLAGVAATHQIWTNTQLLLVGSFGHDETGASRNVSAQLSYTPMQQIAFVVQSETVDAPGIHQTYPVLNATFYPDRAGYLRLAIDSEQQPGARDTAISAIVQF